MTHLLENSRENRLSQKDINELLKIIEINAFRLTKDFYGENLEKTPSKVKKRMNLKIRKAIETKICYEFNITHIKKLKWIYLVNAKMFVDDLKIQDVITFLQLR